MNVLIVEEDVTARLAVRRALLGTGLQVTISEAGARREAISLLHHHGFDCLLASCDLPDGTGLDLLHDLHTQDLVLPVVLLMDQHDVQDAVEMVKAGAADCLSKTSLTPDLLQQSLRSALRLHQVDQERLRAEGTLQEAAQRQALLIATQQEIAHAERDLDAVLSVVVRRAQEMTRADGGVVELADGEDMLYRAASGTAAAHIGLRLRRSTSLSGRCVAEGRLLLCEDTEEDARVDREACRRIGVRSMVVVPLLFLGRTVGVLKVYSARAHAFSSNDLPLLEMMVSLIVAAMSGVAESEARQALAVSEARQQFAVESAGVGTWHWDIPNNYLAWSEHCRALFGLLPETAMTLDLFYDCIYPDDRAATQVAVERALAERSDYEAEYRAIWPDGSVHWLAAKGRGYYDPYGQPLRFEGIIQDIDEKKRAAEQQETFLRDVLSSVTEGKLKLAGSPAHLPPRQAPLGGPIPLTASGGLRELRQRTQEAAQEAGHADERQYDLVTAVSEAGMNAVVHGGGGVAWVSSGGDGIVQVWVEDHGTGIAVENLPKAALSRGFSTKASLGHGLKMMLDLADRFYLLTGPTTGTTVIIEQERVAPLPAWLREV